jgi:DNA-binding MarR family transcriptional regulator
MSSPDSNKSWRFVTSHTQVLLCLQQNPEVRLRDVAATVGITERAAQRIVTDLVDAGYVTRERVGRRNRYVLNRKIRMRHPSQSEHEIGELLDVLSLAGSTDGHLAGEVDHSRRAD